MMELDTNKEKIAVIHERFYILCQQDLAKTLLLDRLIWLSMQRTLFVDLLQEEQAAGELPQFKEPVKLDKLRGWVRKSANEWASSLMCGVDERTVQRKLDEMVQENLIFKRGEKGKVAEYRPNLRIIETTLESLGFKLEGGRIEEKEVIEPPPDTISQDEWWNATPGIDQAQAKANNRPLDPNDEWRQWAGRQKQLTHAPEYIQKASYLVYQKTGFEPVDKSWTGQVLALWEASGQKEEVLITALERGQTARTSQGLVFSGPRGFLNYARDALARQKVVTTVNGKQKGEVVYVGRKSQNGGVGSHHQGLEHDEDDSSSDN